MRTYCKLERRIQPPVSLSASEVTASNLRDVRFSLTNSSWLPSDPLTLDNIRDILNLARASEKALRAVSPDERVEKLQEAVQLHPWQVSLANNVLDLLLQIRHGNLQLADLVPDQLLPVNDAHTGCWGLIIVDRSAVHVRIRSSDVSALRAATEGLLAALRINQWTQSTAGTDGPASTHRHMFPIDEAHEHVIQSNRADGQEAIGHVHVLSRLGLVAYSASRGPALALWIVTAALAVISAALAAGHFGGTDPGWLSNWTHTTLDRVFTGALGAALVASVTGAQLLQDARRQGTRRVLIRWT
ncbi:hypothetical protein CMMCAS05_03945 [Clavibacter michiganensis subsp. michiganensis]|uniref:hypothetical protein n=1 Tax=Clavibacter michiganensis TaxID=28447 RepID=UPI000B747049|nr:hypothetical protein [Clavibacter michiganensis]OUD94427.1 hypothetical protein CMMCAS05_03945 [Clavibacter michiganensis subsp. michiganensis]OUE11392.1 hypothetical protein CMMCAY01_00175 [Clavibacter michiganensis subsp. michiganensis]